MKLSIEEVKKRFKNLDCRLISTEYKNIYEKLDFVCNKHLNMGIQQTSVANVNKGICCHFCGKENSRNSRRVPEEELKRITENVGFIYVGNELINGNRYIVYKCPKHLYIGEQKTLVSTMRRSKGNCPECLNRNKDTNKFITELKNLNNNIEILGEYIGSHEKIKCRCKICGHEWYGIPNNLLSGEGCRKCSDIKKGLQCRNTEQWFIDKMKKMHPNIEVLSKFTTMKNYVQCKCIIDGYLWNATPDSLINQKTGCTKCANKKNGLRCRKTNEEFKEKLKKINPHIIPLEKYTTDKNKIKCICSIHNYEWYTTPNKILNRQTGCPKCASYNGENKIDCILEEWGYKYEIQKRFEACQDKSCLPLDRYLPDFNIAIEYDGEQHFYPVKFGSTPNEALEKYKKTCLHDEIKNQYCKDNNIPLIRIPYWEKDNMQTFLFDELVKYGAIQLVS